MEENKRDSIYDELDQVKSESEKLREECRVKTDLSNSLRKAQIGQLAKIQETKLENEKLVQELNAKSEEISEIRKMYEELQSSLHRKELFLQQISSSNENLRAEYGEKILKLEGANRDLILSLDEASARIHVLEMKTCLSDEEIASLKRFISVKLDKGVELEKKELKELTRRESRILKLEEENRIIQDQLKWKNEQFLHLEEAYRKLQTNLETSKVEWQKEKSVLVEEISSLQVTLDAQVRVSESLETQLRMCNQTLAHEESRRKILEIELSESRSRFENVLSECEVAKSEIEQLTTKREEEIAELRTLLRKKDTLFDEMEYRTAQLEQENNDLRGSVKDVQQSQLNNNVTSSSFIKLKNKFRDLKELHNKCAANLKEKEAEWNSEMEKLKGGLESCLSELEGKNRSIGEIHKELEDCQWLLEIKNEEIFSLIMVLKSEFYVAYSKLYDEREKLEMNTKKAEERNLLLEQQLESKNSELHNIHGKLKQKCDEISVLTEQVEDSDSLEKQKNNLQEERKSYGLANEAFEVEKSKLELLKWKDEVKNLKVNLEEIQQVHKQENATHVVILKDKDAEISELHEQICQLQALIVEKSEAAEILKQEKDNCMRNAEDRNCIIENLQNEFSQLKNELAKNKAGNIDLIEAVKTLEQENTRFSSNIDERDRKIQELMKQVESLDQNLSNAMISFEQKENLHDESLKKANEEKNETISNLEKEMNDLCKKLEFQENLLIQSKQEALHLEALSKAKNCEMENLNSELENERRYFECLLEELKSQKQVLLEDLKKASIDRDELRLKLESICGQMELLCKEDVELMSVLGTMVNFYEESSEISLNLLVNGGLNDSIFSPSKSMQVTVDEGNPLAELNC